VIIAHLEYDWHACIHSAGKSLRVLHCTYTFFENHNIFFEFKLAAAGRTQGSPRYTLQYSSSPFGFAVSRSDGSSNAPLFNTAGKRLVFKV